MYLPVKERGMFERTCLVFKYLNRNPMTIFVYKYKFVTSLRPVILLTVILKAIALGDLFSYYGFPVNTYRSNSITEKFTFNFNIPKDCRSSF